MRSYHLIEALSNAKGISGFEKDVLREAKHWISSDLSTRVAGLNNMYIERDGDLEQSDKPLLLLDSHTDELGFMIQSITSRGLLKVVPVGSWDPRNIPAHSVLVKVKDGFARGVFASKPPHFMSEEEKRQGVSIEKLVIDIGAVSRQEAIEFFGVYIGAPVVPDVALSVLGGTRLMGKAFDNRMGCALVIDLMNHFKNKALGVRLVGSLSAQEEVGTRGAKVASYDLRPDIAIVFEGTPSDDGFTDLNEVQGGIGMGCQIRHRDASMISHPEMTAFAIDVAKRQGIKYQEAVRSGGGTDAGVYHMANQGIPSIVLGVPVRYAHTHFGISDYADYEAAFQWGVALIEAINAELIASFTAL